MNEKLKISQLGHTWFFDLDGTVVKHNGYLTDSGDELLEGAAEFFKSISEKDKIVFITSRSSDYKEKTETFLQREGIRYDHIIFDLPYGERILVNDIKPGGLQTSIAVNTQRDEWAGFTVEEDPFL